MGVSLQNVDDDYYMDEDWEVDLYDDRAASPSNAGSTGSVSGAAGGITLNQLELLQTLMVKKAALEKLSAASSKLASELSGLLDDVADAAKYTSELTDSLEMLTEDTASMA